jgi:hypothetical protein
MTPIPTSRRNQTDSAEDSACNHCSDQAEIKDFDSKADRCKSPPGTSAGNAELPAFTTGISRSSADCALLLSLTLRQIDSQSHKVTELELFRCHPPADSPRLIILAQPGIQNHEQCLSSLFLSSLFLRVSMPAPSRFQNSCEPSDAALCLYPQPTGNSQRRSLRRSFAQTQLRSDAASLRRSFKFSLSCLFYSHNSKANARVTDVISFRFPARTKAIMHTRATQMELV